MLSYLRRQGYLSSKWIAEKRGKKGYRLGLYQLTEKGLNALETGLVPLLVNPPTSFNNRNVHHGKVRVVQACQHHYIVGPPPLQHHRCTECKKEFDVPMTYGVELSRVGAGRPRGSERYKARLLEVGVSVGRTAVDFEERDE